MADPFNIVYDQNQNDYELSDGSSIAVVGGGPAGSFFSYYALQFASRMDLDITLDIYEAKNFLKIGSGGCNHCGGIVSESLVQQLSTDGIVIPSKIIQRGIKTYTMHVEQGDVVIDTPSHESRIASVFRGCGPKGCLDTSQRSFDNYLLDLCREKGANVIGEKVSQLERCEDGILLKAGRDTERKYDLVVGAAGLNNKTLEMFGSVLPGFVPPEVTRTYISEFFLERETVDRHFSDSMHVFLLDIPNITFGAMIPKEDYVTLVLLGKDIDKDIVADFLKSDQVKARFPEGLRLHEASPCKCYPFINVKEARNAYADRVVLIGDSASSKLYKNGIGAAYITGRAAAKTAIIEGVSKVEFDKFYKPVCRQLDLDNKVGKFIFLATRIIQKSAWLKRGLLHTVLREQSDPAAEKRMSSALWDTFTGSAGYRNILWRFFNPSLLFNYFRSILISNLNPKTKMYYEKREAGTAV